MSSYWSSIASLATDITSSVAEIAEEFNADEAIDELGTNTNDKLMNRFPDESSTNNDNLLHKGSAEPNDETMKYETSSSLSMKDLSVDSPVLASKSRSMVDSSSEISLESKAATPPFQVIHSGDNKHLYHKSTDLDMSFADTSSSTTDHVTNIVEMQETIEFFRDSIEEVIQSLDSKSMSKTSFNVKQNHNRDVFMINNLKETIRKELLEKQYPTTSMIDSTTSSSSSTSKDSNNVIIDENDKAPYTPHSDVSASDSAKLQDSLQELQDNNESMRLLLIEEREKASKHINGLETRFLKLQSDCRKSYARENVLEKELDETTIALQDAQNKVDSLESSMSVMHENILEDEEVKHVDALSELQKKLNAFSEANSALEKEVSKLNEQLELSDRDAAVEIKTLSEEKTVIREKMIGYQETQHQLEMLKGMVHNITADIKLKDQDIAMGEESLFNLQNVLLQFQTESKLSAKKYEETIGMLRSEVEFNERQIENTKSLKDEEWKSNIDVIGDSLNRSNDTKDRLLKELENTRNQLNIAISELNDRSDGYMVDKRIVSKLLVTYLDRDNNDDVLEVMCNLIDFTPQERQKVFQFKRKENNSGISSWFSGYAASTTTTSNSTTAARRRNSRDGAIKETDNLSDAWVDFLLSEMGENDTALTDGKSRIDFVPKVNIAESPKKKERK